MDHQKVLELLAENDAAITDLQGRRERIDQELKRRLRHRSNLLSMLPEDQLARYSSGTTHAILPPRLEGGRPDDTADRRDMPRNGAPGVVLRGRAAVAVEILREAGRALTTQEIMDALIARGDGHQFPRELFWRTVDAVLRRLGKKGIFLKVGRATWTLPGNPAQSRVISSTLAG